MDFAYIYLFLKGMLSSFHSSSSLLVIWNSSNIMNSFKDRFALNYLNTGLQSYRFSFNGMEQDDEVKGSGNHYTTFFRQYDPRLGRWLSIDPLNQFLESQYKAYQNNPIVFVDPNGGWIPEVKKVVGVKKNKDGTKTKKEKGYKLVAKMEEGDSEESLAVFLDISVEEAVVLYKSRDKNGYIVVPESIAKPINEAIQHMKENSDLYSKNTIDRILMDMAGFYNYNCHGSSLSIARGVTPNFRRRTEQPELKQKINDNFSDVTGSPNKWEFARTLVTFGKNPKIGDPIIKHSAIYLGTSRNGTQYFWTKNGYFQKPKVMTLSELEKMYGHSQSISDDKGSKEGYYNFND